MMIARFFKLFLAPIAFFFAGFALVGMGLDRFGLGEGLQLVTAVVSFVIVLAGVIPGVIAGLAAEKSGDKWPLVLMGGSFAKVVTIGVLVIIVRRTLVPFGDKNFFLIWLFLSFLVISSIGWIVVTAKASSGE